MAREIRIKRGDMLALTLTFVEQDAPQPIDSATLNAQVRNTMDTLIASLPIVVTGTLGQATIDYPTTVDWPLGALRCDVSVAIAGVTQHTETFGIHVDRAVTQ